MSDPQALAAKLISAATRRTAIEALTSSEGAFDIDTAYQVQQAVAGRRKGGIVGAKLGLTSVAKQRQMNVSEPLYGWLTADMAIDVGQPLRCADYIQPRCEPEVAFLLGEDLAGEHVTASDVLAACTAVYPAIDVLDSRFAGYSFKLADVIADNASGAGFVLGGQATWLAGIDLRLTGVTLEKNGELVATAAGAASLGHPAAAVAWLVRALTHRQRFSGGPVTGLRSGQVILSGGLTEAVPVSPGDVVVARFDRIGTVELACR